MSESLVGADSKFRRYTQNVEKILHTFEAITEWPDLISFLTRLLKVINTYQQYKIMPCKIAIGKRLAQCLNPALPSGVHSKTLETYECIFSTIGPEHLLEDFFVYSFGLLPFFEHCSTAVKPQFFHLLDSYILPITSRLNCCKTSLFSSIVIGLEDECSEHFKQTIEFVEALRSHFGVSDYSLCIVTCFVSSPKHRVSIVNLLSKGSFRNIFDAQLSDRWSMLIDFVGAGVDDDNILVQRAVMDFIADLFPISQDTLPKEIRLSLVEHLLNLLTKKDMSLTRRFFSWVQFQEHDESISSDAASCVTLSLLKLIGKCVVSDQYIAIFKIMICLLDNGNFSEQILPNVLVPLVRLSMTFTCNNSFDKIRIANQFFEIVDLCILWNSLCRLIEDCNSGDTLSLIQFAILNLSICDSDVVSGFLPDIVHALVASLDNENVATLTLKCDLIRLCLETIEKTNRTCFERLDKGLLLEYLDAFLARSIKIACPQSATLSILEAACLLEQELPTQGSEFLRKYVSEAQESILDQIATNGDNAVKVMTNLIALDRRCNIFSRLAPSFVSQCIPIFWSLYDRLDCCNMKDILLWLYSHDPVYFDHSVCMFLQLATSDSFVGEFSKFQSLWNTEELSEYHNAFGTTLFAILKDTEGGNSIRSCIYSSWLAASFVDHHRIMNSILFLFVSFLLKGDGQGESLISDHQLVFSLDNLSTFISMCSYEFLMSYNPPIDISSTIMEFWSLNRIQGEVSGKSYPEIHIQTCLLLIARGDLLLQLALLNSVHVLCIRCKEASFPTSFLTQLFVFLTALPPKIAVHSGAAYQTLQVLFEWKKEIHHSADFQSALLDLVPSASYLSDISSECWRSLHKKLMPAFPAFRDYFVRLFFSMLEFWLDSMELASRIFQPINDNLIWLVSNITEATKAEREQHEHDPLVDMLCLKLHGRKYSAKCLPLTRLFCERFPMQVIRSSLSALDGQAEESIPDDSALVVSLCEANERRIMDALIKLFKAGKPTSAILTSYFHMIVKEVNANSAKYRVALPIMIHCATFIHFGSPEWQNLDPGQIAELQDAIRRLVENCSMILHKSMDYICTYEDTEFTFSPAVFAREKTSVLILKIMLEFLKEFQSVSEHLQRVLFDSLFSNVALPMLGFKKESIGFKFSEVFLHSFSRLYESEPRDIRSVFTTSIDVDSTLCSAKVRLILLPYLRAALKREGASCWKDILEKLAGNLSGNLFTSRETEIQGRISILRKMCFMTLASNQSLLLMFWPLIIEKIVEIFKNRAGGPIFHAYMFLRAASFWVNLQTINSFMPILCSHMFQVFQETIDTPSPDWWQEVSGICHFLDLLLLLHPTALATMTWGFISIDSDSGLIAETCQRHGVDLPLPEEPRSANSRKLILSGRTMSRFEDLAEFVQRIRSRLTDLHGLVPPSAKEMSGLIETSIVDI